jgi:hypothetical protein
VGYNALLFLVGDPVFLDNLENLLREYGLEILGLFLLLCIAQAELSANIFYNFDVIAFRKRNEGEVPFNLQILML